jgi:origin recognition complex subunit 2
MITVLNEAINGRNESISEELKLIERLKEIDFDLYLVIHSMDILCANNMKIKSFVYKCVSKCKRLHIIASVDHINSSLIWSTNEWNAYKWLTFNVPTLEPYVIEKAFSSGLSMISSSSKSWTQSLTLSSIQHVYDSLTTNAQKIFVLILNNFIRNEETNSGFAFSDCYTLCREEFLVNSETTLRAQISEFKDHKLLKLKKGVDGSEVIDVCIEKSVAQKFISRLA